MGQDSAGISEILKKRIDSYGGKDIINLAKTLLNPTQLALLANAPTATVEVERVFSLVNKLLAKNRDFAPENFFWYLLLKYQAEIEIFGAMCILFFVFKT